MRPQIPPLGSLLIDPPPPEWVTHVRGQAPAGASLVALARTFSRQQGLQFAEGQTGRVILSGHQPGFIHPGIWVKMFVLEAMAEMLDATCVHLQVDSDLPTPLAPPLPPSHERVPFYMPPGGQPFEALPAPPRADWDRFVGAVEGVVRTPRLQVAGTAAWEALGPHPSLGLFLDRVRREYEQPRRYLELPISHLCDTDGFRSFVAEVLNRLEAFHLAYNGCLARYRKQHKVRSAANPIPDLRHRSDAVESPFWVVDRQGVRRGLWVTPDGTLLAREVPIGRFDGTAGSLEGLALRPRALTLTLYCRRYVCDLFVHGVGGARYDGITDGIFVEFWQVAAPRYACVSLSLAPGAVEKPPADPRRTHLALRDLRHNPQRSRAYAGENAAGLMEQKQALLLQIAGTPARQQGPLASEIRRVNAALAPYLTERRLELERQLERDTAEAQRYQAATARDYPYFCFEPTAISALVARAIDFRTSVEV